MSAVDAVKAAKNPQEALLAIAQAIDDLHAEMAKREVAEDTWGEWVQDVERELMRGFTVEESADGEQVTVDFAAATDPEKRQRREQFARAVMNLPEQFPGQDGEELVAAYVKAGPLWLYTGNRAFFMGLPVEWRQIMVDDVLEDDPATGHEMARDVLKDETPGRLPSLGGEE